MFFKPDDVVIIAPVVILLLGLILTNVNGYFDEKTRDELKVAKAAAVDADLLYLLHRDGRKICSGKPTKAWKRLQVRQALGRGIPLSMVSFYLASRSLIEAPTCQLSATLTRNILKGNLNATSKLTELQEQQEQDCTVDSPFRFALGCPSIEEMKNQAALLDEIRHARRYYSNETVGDELKLAENAIWQSGHCSQSTWRLRLKEKHGEEYEECGYEACVMAEPPDGPSKVFNQHLHGLLMKGAEDSKDLKKSVKRLVSKFHRGAAFGLGVFWNNIVRGLGPDETLFRLQEEVVITSRRSWEIDFLLGFIFLVASMMPLAKAVQERRCLKSFHGGSIWIHFGIDILLVECAIIGILTSLFIHEGGRRMTELINQVLNDTVLATNFIADSIDHGQEANSRNVEDLQKAAAHALKVVDGKNLISEVAMHVSKSVQALADPLMVHKEFFCLFGIAVVFFSSLSTIFVRNTSVAGEMPWMTQWNAAIGGPLHLLGSVRDEEVKALCVRVQGQIVLRGFLLTLLLAIFMFPVSSFDAALASALVLQKPMSRTPWIVAWIFLWGIHMVTGILAVFAITENQAFRDEDRWLRDTEAYGACGMPSQGPVMGMKPHSLPTQSIPPTSPPGLQVPQTSPPGLQVPQTPPPGLQVPQTPPPGIQVPQAPPPGLQVPKAPPAGVQVLGGPPGMQAQEP